MATKPTVVIVEPASSGVALLREARELGFRVAVATYDKDDRRLPEAVRRYADVLMEVDTNDDDALASAVLSTAASERLAAVVPGFEFYVPTAARLGRRLGLPALSAETALACRDKSIMRDTVHAAGIRVPRYVSATDELSLAAAARRVGFPCVLKPTTSAGSIHVSRADNWDQLRSAYQRLVTDDRLDCGRRLDGTVLVEEYIAGPEVSVEGFVADGRVEVLAVTAKVLGPEPFFVEIGHIVHAQLSEPTRMRLERYTVEVVRALGISIGAFHCEVRLDREEPVLIELGARLAGDHIVDLVELTTGLSLPRLMLATYAGTGVDMSDFRRARTAAYAGVRFFTPSPTVDGWLAGVGRGLLEEPWVVESDFAGGVSPGAHEDFRCRVGHAVFVADDYETAEQRWRTLGEVALLAA